MGNQNWTQPTNAGAFFQQSEKRLGMEERRLRVTKASDLLGPLSGPSAVLLNDSLNSNLTAFNGLFIVPPGTPESPDNTKWWVGESIAQDGIGGVQILRTFQTDDIPHRTVMRGWQTVTGTGGLRAYSDWEEYATQHWVTTAIAAATPPDAVAITMTAISPFTNTLRLWRVNNTVHCVGYIQRATSFSTSFVNAVQIPVGFRPNVARGWPQTPLGPWSSPTIFFQLDATAAVGSGVAYIRTHMSAANANGQYLDGTWLTDD